jgi:hypothetical protein
MFEDATPDALISEIEASQQRESALMAHRLAAIAALLSQRIAEAEDADPDPGYAMIVLPHVKMRARVVSLPHVNVRAWGLGLWWWVRPCW